MYIQWYLAGVFLTSTVCVVTFLTAFVLFNISVVNPESLLVNALVYGSATAATLVFARQLSQMAGVGVLLGSLVAFPMQIPVLIGVANSSKSALSAVPAEPKWMLLGLFFGILYALLGLWSMPYLLKE